MAKKYLASKHMCEREREGEWGRERVIATVVHFCLWHVALSNGFEPEV